jgi:hypothetical protein
MGGKPSGVMLRLLTVMAVAAAAALAACGSSGSSASSPAASTGPASRSTTASMSTSTATATVTAAPTSTAATTTASASTPAATAGGGACTAAHLSASFLGGQGATGHGELGFALRNTGSAPCHTYGYPGIQFASSAGAPLPTTPQHTTSDFFGSLPLRRVTVAPGQSFSFRLGTSHGNGASTGCSTARTVAIIPPDDTVALHVAIPNGGAVECGATTVSPVQPGVTAYH